MKIRKLILTVQTATEAKTCAVIDFTGQIIQWDGPPELQAAAKPALEAMWLALASDGFLEKKEKSDAG